MLARGEAANAETDCAPFLGRRYTNQDNNRQACVTNLPAFPLVPSFCFSRSSTKHTKVHHLGFTTYLPLLGKSQKCKACLSLPQLGDSRGTHWPGPFWESCSSSPPLFVFLFQPPFQCSDRGVGGMHVPLRAHA